MNLRVERVEVWAAPIQDKPGALAEALTALAEAGANLQFLIARRAPEKPGTGVVFVTPVQGDKQIQAAQRAGFNPSQKVQSVRVSGPDKPGIAGEVARKLSGAGINLRGFSASAIGNEFVAYIALDSQADANKAVEVLKS